MWSSFFAIDLPTILYYFAYYYHNKCEFLNHLIVAIEATFKCHYLVCDTW
jgi:hypothetical protein